MARAVLSPPSSSLPGSLAELSHPPRSNFAFDVAQSDRALEAIVRVPEHWSSHFPKAYHGDIAFLLDHPSGQNLKTHFCMGAAHTNTFRTANHTRVTPHILLAAEIGIEMVERLRLKPDEAKDLIAAIAGHDQGHIFASHQSETAINSFPEFDGSLGRPKFCHEARTKELFTSEEFKLHFGIERLDRIKSILFDSSNRLHLLVDWADRFASLMADSIHLGDQEIVHTTNVRSEFMESLEVLPDGTIGFNNLRPLGRLISARDMLYMKVAEGSAATLFQGFLVEAYHRAVAYRNTTPTAFVREIAELSTPQARELFHPKDTPRLFNPYLDPIRAKPVDLDFIPAIHITRDMLSEKGQYHALEAPKVSPADSTPACRSPRAGMSSLELAIRSHFSCAEGSGYLESIGAVIGTANMAQKQYNVRVLRQDGGIQRLQLFGTPHWELFLAIPRDCSASLRDIHKGAARALAAGGFIETDSRKNPTALQKLKTIPPRDLFTRG